MAKIYADANQMIVAIRLNEAEEAVYPVPGGSFTFMLEFDPETNPHIMVGINEDYNAHRCNASQLLRNGVPVNIAAPGEKHNLKATALTLIDTLQQYRDNPSPTNAQSVAVIKVLCRVVIYFLRSLR